LGTKAPTGSSERMNVKRWMQSWQIRFGSLGVEVIVADVAQSSVVVDIAERTVILASHLTVVSADKALRGLYRRWAHKMENPGTEFYALTSC